MSPIHVVLKVRESGGEKARIKNKYEIEIRCALCELEKAEGLSKRGSSIP